MRKRKAKQKPTTTRRIDRAELRAVLAEGQTPTGEVLAWSAAATIEAQAAGEDGKPKLPKVSIVAYNGGPMMVGGYFRPVVVELSGLGGTERAIPLLRDHDTDRIVGHGQARIAGGSLVVEGVLSGVTNDASEIAQLAANGYPWQASVGVQPSRIENIDAGASVVVNGRTLNGPAYVVRAGRLREVSFVATGADGTTSAAVAAQMGDNMNFEAWLKAKGFDAATLSADQKTALKAAYDASGWDNGGGSSQGGQAGQGGQGSATGGQAAPVNATGGPTSGQAAIAAARARQEREAAYGRIIASAVDAGMTADEADLLYRQAVEAQMSETQFELEVLRATRNVDAAPYGFARRRSGAEPTADVVECALAATAQMTEFERLEADGSRKAVQLYSADVQQRAADAFPRGLTLVELVAMAARRNGYSDNTHRISKAMLQAAFAPVQARGASTYDLSGVLSNVANKSIMAGFDAIENTWREVSKISTVTDFKEITHYALTGDFVYEQVGKGGELRNATMGEQAYGNKADSYGKIFAITRQDFINDDLGAFDRVRSMLGRGAALRLNLVFWTEFLKDVSTFFTSGRGNYFEGASSALSITSLGTAETMFFDQTDPDGNPLGVNPAILLTPNATSTLGVQLTRDTEIRDNTASKVYTTANPHAGKFRPVRSSYLNNTNVPNGSATHFFLLADPMDLPMIEVVFLNGQQRPIVEAAEADFDILGVQMRGYHDFGARKQEYRAAVRSKGAA